MKTGFPKRDERTLMKLVVEQKTNKVVGVHIVGPDGPEMIQIAAIAVKAGLTKHQWDETCALHPTAGRGAGDPARQVRPATNCSAAE